MIRLARSVFVGLRNRFAIASLTKSLSPWSAAYQNTVKKLSPLLSNRLRKEKSKMAAATARQIPVVNNVITDEDLDNFRTEGKVSMLEM